MKEYNNHLICRNIQKSSQKQSQNCQTRRITEQQSKQILIIIIQNNFMICISFFVAYHSLFKYAKPLLEKFHTHNQTSRLGFNPGILILNNHIQLVFCVYYAYIVQNFALQAHFLGLPPFLKIATKRADKVTNHLDIKVTVCILELIQTFFCFYHLPDSTYIAERLTSRWLPQKEYPLVFSILSGNIRHSMIVDFLLTDKGGKKLEEYLRVKFRSDHNIYICRSRHQDLWSMMTFEDRQRYSQFMAGILTQSFLSLLVMSIDQYDDGCNQQEDQYPIQG